MTLLCQNEVDPEATFALLRRAKRRGARTILNLAPAAPVPAAVLDALDVLVVNEIEAAMAAGDPGSDPQILARELASRHDLTCVVTLGAQGAVARAPVGGWRIGPLAIEPVDTTGAGDALNGILAAELARGADLSSALRWAMVGAALKTTQPGAQAGLPSRDTIAQHIRRSG
jgi:ribokinase